MQPCVTQIVTLTTTYPSEKLRHKRDICPWDSFLQFEESAFCKILCVCSDKYLNYLCIIYIIITSQFLTCHNKCINGHKKTIHNN